MFKKIVKYIFDKKKIDWLITLISLIFSFNLVVGKYCFENLYSTNNSLFVDLLKPKMILSFAGLFILILFVLAISLDLLKKHSFKENKIKLKKYQIFLLSFISIVILWLPYILSFFPATMSLDSLGELKIGISHNIWHDSQPVIHQLLLVLCNSIAKLFSSKAITVAITYTIIQYTLLALVVAYTITFAYENIKNKHIILIMILFYGLIPIFGYYSVVMWKDVIYGALVLLLTIFVYKLINKENIEKSFYIKFYLISIICLLFRTNAIYMYFLLVLGTYLLYKNNRLKIFLLYLSVIITFYIIKIPVFNHFNIQRSASAEYLAMPLQQIGRMNYKDIQFTEEEKKVINNLIPLDVLKETYDPKTSDGIKFNTNYNGKYFDNNKFKVLSTWFKLCLKHPSTAIESYLISTLGYWYPGLEDRYYESSIIENDIGIKQMPIKNKVITGYVKFTGNYNNIVIKMLWSIGLYVWILIISIYLIMKLKTKKYLLPYIPVVGNIITLFIATPVYNEVRYVFSLYLCSILLFLMPYFSDKISKKSDNYEK